MRPIPTLLAAMLTVAAFPAAAVYGPADRRLRRDGVRDFEFILVPLTDANPTENDALAIGVNGRLRLTTKGRGC